MGRDGGQKKDDRREKGVFPSMDKKTILERIKKELSKEIGIDEIYLFGSRARGDFYKNSDYDLAIISKDFKDKTFMQRQKLVRPLVRKVLNDSPIETICYTPKEFKKGLKNFLPEKIEKEGIKV